MSVEYGSEAVMRGAGMRTRLVSMALLGVFGIIAARGAVVATSYEGERGGVSTAFEAPVRRADIVDRHGELLATSVTAYSLFADPRAMMDGDLVADTLATVLPGLDLDKIKRRLADRERAFVWIERDLTPRQ
ncbi:MAG: penicillin-binding protein 2, partial [Pseudomonadota bacterium]